MNKHQCPNCFMEFEDEEEETYGPCRKDETPLPTCCGCAFILFVFIGCWALLYVGGFLCLWFLGKMPNVANPLPAIREESLPKTAFGRGKASRFRTDEKSPDEIAP